MSGHGVGSIQGYSRKMASAPYLSRVQVLTAPTLRAEAMLDKLPSGLAKMASKHWLRLANEFKDGLTFLGFGTYYTQADLWLNNLLTTVYDNRLPFDVNISDSGIVEYGRATAIRFTRFVGAHRFSFKNVFIEAAKQVDVLSIFIKSKYHDLGVEKVSELLNAFPPDSPAHYFKNSRHTCRSIAARFQSASFWVRQMRRIAAREIEVIFRHKLGQVHRRDQLYVSNEQVRRRREQKARNQSILALISVINELGEEFQLDELVAGSNANPAIRRAELMVRIAGFEHMAQELEHVGEFITLTCPSRFHARAAKNSRENPKFDGSSPIEAQAYLNKVWARIGAALAREDIKIYGFRVAEPHHDGCPHWHGLFFMPSQHRQRFRQIVARYACREDRQELCLFYHDTKREAAAAARKQWQFYCNKAAAAGTRRPLLKDFEAQQKTEADVWAQADYKLFHKVAARVLFKAIDWSKGTAAGYIAKYIAKNIDGKNAHGESIGGDYEAEDYLSLVDSAARVDAWASTWGIRQFQQVGGAPVTVWRELRRLRIGSYHDGDIIERAAAAADKGDWGKFTVLMGGFEMGRSERPIKLYKENMDEENAYGELRDAEIKGVLATATGEILYSRNHIWTMKNRKQTPAAAVVLGFERGDSPAWTCVNNSTNLDLTPKGFDDESIAFMMEESTKLMRHFKHDEISAMTRWVVKSCKVIDYKSINKAAAVLMYANVINDIGEESVRMQYQNFDHFFNAIKRERRIINAAAVPKNIADLELQAANIRIELANMHDEIEATLNRMSMRTATVFDLTQQGINTQPAVPTMNDLMHEYQQQQDEKYGISSRLKAKTLGEQIHKAQRFIDKMQTNQELKS